jgi:hypothetical protein
MRATKQNNGIAFQLEHRYYGSSETVLYVCKQRPLPHELVLRNPEKAENMRWLTSQQALADAAAFIGYAVGRYNLSLDTKWIAVGGSYSGEFMRQFLRRLICGFVQVVCRRGCV